MHLVIAFAAALDPACAEALRALRLPNLEALLAGMAEESHDLAGEATLNPPHERAHAQALGLAAPDGLLPWAARTARRQGLDAAGDGWAFITPVHWDVATQAVGMRDPDTLALQEDESRALMAAMEPYFTEDGIRLQHARAGSWLGRAERFRALPTASLDRAVSADIGPWMPADPLLRRLQNEMQMLLYTHPANEARTARGARPVNSFWVSATGALPEAASTDEPPGLHLELSLRATAWARDWEGWSHQWQALDAGTCAMLRQGLERGDPDTRLTLCGERGARRYAPRTRRWWERLRGRADTNRLAAHAEGL